MTALPDIPLKTIDGEPTSLARYDGQVLLVVNVASRCGLTPQYAGLEALQRKYGEEGLVVLGFPSNDFAGQEPGNDAEIAQFCSTTYDVSFPMFAKTEVTGPDRHPLFSALVEALPTATGPGSLRERLAEKGLPVSDKPDILWNFEKFVIGRDGTPVARFAPDVLPDDDRLVQAIERELFASE